MKNRLVSMALVVLLSVAGASALTEATPAKASISHTTPAKTRGTWYSYDKWSKNFTKIRITKRTFTYRGSFNVKVKNLDVQTFKNKGKNAYVFKSHKSTAAADFYTLGKAKVKGKYKKCLVSSSGPVFFKSKIKHYSSVK